MWLGIQCRWLHVVRQALQVNAAGYRQPLQVVTGSYMPRLMVVTGRC